jgi:anaerobic selenocysteine-containing dehydrogenase
LAIHYRTCTLCEAMCGVEIEHEGERVLAIRGDKDDVLSRGHICPKAVALQDVQNDPDRLRRPMIRSGSEWREVAWAEAYDLVERRIRGVQQAHGRDAVASYLGNPTVHSLGAILFAPGLVRALRSRNRYTATSVDQLPHHVAAQQMFGHGLLLPVPDLDRTDHLLILGANPATSNGSLLSAGDVVGRMKELRRRGGRIVLVDPRRTETADLCDAHHATRPGSDAFLLLAILNVVFAEARTNLGRIEPFTDGLSAIRDLAQRFPPGRVADAVGLPAETIVALARDFAQAERPVAYGRVGISMQEFGGLACWLVNVLNAVTGRLDTEGGAMFAKPAVEVMRIGGALGARRLGRFRSRVRGLPEFASELPVAALAEEIETPGPGQVRALVTHAGNPVLSTPNGGRLDRALAGLEFFAAVDSYVNETTRHAHVILPPTGPLEREHYDLVFHVLAVRNTAKYSEALFPRRPDERHDWEILNELTARLALGGAVARLRARATAFVLSRLRPRGLVALGLRSGPYGAGFAPFARGLTLARLLRSPHGVDLGPLAPAFPEGLRTEDRRIHLAPPAFVADVARLETALTASTPSGSLALIGRRHLRSNNSWMHNSERLVRGRRRVTLEIHPEDARHRGIADGVTVLVRSRVGELRVEAEVTERVRPGVVCLPHGWGHGRPGTRLSVANAHPGASINDLTDDARVDALTGTAAFSGVPVTVCLAKGA